MPAIEPVVTPVTPVVPPQIGTPEYDAAMVAKFDSTITPEAPTTVKPEGVPEKFWNATTGVVDFTAWGKSTAELEAKFTQSKAPAKPEVVLPTQPLVTPEAPAKTAEQLAADAAAEAAKSPEQKAIDAAAKTQVDAAAALDAKGLDIKDFNAEYAEKGELSVESYARLAKVGFDKATVDAVIAGQTALAAQRDNEGYAVAGGKEAFTRMAAWAASSMTVSERVAFNNATLAGADSMKLAVAGLKAQYEAANGKDPTLVGGDPASNLGVGFKSRAEMTAAMRDPRYGRDPAYRAAVEAKVGAATFQ